MLSWSLLLDLGFETSLRQSNPAGCQEYRYSLLSNTRMEQSIGFRCLCDIYDLLRMHVTL